METFYLILVLFLLLNLAGGLIRVQRGPTPNDRMVASLLFGTTGVAVLLVLAESSGLPSLRDVALVFSVLAAVNTVAFVRHTWDGSNAKGERS
ncbi:MAG TPA: monovalent cation/H+ antiporter complex subunit F [Chloroflexota bacterium]|nr:monovalent cation/H+ antiporter complex subunit F [Chloroflexota bacterium]